MANAKPPVGGGGERLTGSPPVALQIITDASRLVDSHPRIHSASTTEQKQRLYNSMNALAESCINNGMTQTAADILAFLLLQTDMDTDLLDRAEELFADLKGRVCPRVILNVRAFAADMDLLTMVGYLLDIVKASETDDRTTPTPHRLTAV